MMTMMGNEHQMLKLGDEQIRLLERLANACAVSGDEGEVRKIVLKEVQPHADEVKVDALGNVLVTRRGSGNQPMRVMLAAHMDEVGLMLTHETEAGIYRFETIGDISTADLAGKALWIGKEHIPGVIGLEPVHLLKDEELKKPVELENLHIDVGIVKGNEKVGDRATFATSFAQIGPSLRGKALDDRLGVTTLIELVKHAPPDIDMLAAFTVQEEIGLRGARVAAFSLDPDMAIVLDSTPANDLPVWDEDENLHYNTRLGAGPAIYVADKGTLSDPRLVRYMIKTAEENSIPFQIRQPGGGDNDSMAIHKQREGIPSISISVPGRYHHSPAAIVRMSDWQYTCDLIMAALYHLTPEVLSGER